MECVYHGAYCLSNMLWVVIVDFDMVRDLMVVAA